MITNEAGAIIGICGKNRNNESKDCPSDSSSVGQSSSGGSSSGNSSNSWNDLGSDPVQEKIDEINRGDREPGIYVPSMNGIDTEYAHGNHWWGYFPVSQVLGRKYSDLELNLTHFAIPQQVMGSTSASFKGYSYEFPTHLLDADQKEITIEYIVDEKWRNYRALFKWCSAFEGQINRVIDTSDANGISVKDFIDCRIFLLDHFKNNIISFTFHNCWVKIFQELTLDAATADEVKHSITLAYSNYTIDDVVI